MGLLIGAWAKLISSCTLGENYWFPCCPPTSNHYLSIALWGGWRLVSFLDCRRILCRWNGREEGRPTPSLNMMTQGHLCRQKWRFGPFPPFWDDPWKGRTHPQNFWLPLQELEQGVMRSVRKGGQDGFIWVYSDDMAPSFLLRWWLHDLAVELC